jgi:hypothetical protein
MNSRSELFDRAEDFFEAIINEDQNDELSLAIESARCFFADLLDGKIYLSSDRLADAYESRLEEIWDLISEQEKQENSDLEEYYLEATSDFESFCGFDNHADEVES